MQIDWNTRMEIYKNSNEKQRYFYSKPIVGIFFNKIKAQFETLTADNKYSNFVTLIGDIILGFYKIEDTVPLLQQELGLDPKTAAVLGAEVLEFLAPLSDPNWQPPAEETTNELAETNQIPAQATPAFSIPIKAPPLASSIPVTAPVSSPAPATVPTYEPTPVAEPVHQSTQPATTLSTIPNYTPAPIQTPPTPAPEPDRPRWSTDF